MNEQELSLEIEELEERIAPHFSALGGGAAVVEAWTHDPDVRLLLPDGSELGMPAQPNDGLLTAWEGPVA
jgi:hypothetical protein